MFSEEELGPMRSFLKMQERMSDAFSDKEMDKQVADEITATLRKAGITPEQAQNMSPEVCSHASVGHIPVLESGLVCNCPNLAKDGIECTIESYTSCTLPRRSCMTSFARMRTILSMQRHIRSTKPSRTRKKGKHLSLPAQSHTRWRVSCSAFI